MCGLYSVWGVAGSTESSSAMQTKPGPESITVSGADHGAKVARLVSRGGSVSQPGQRSSERRMSGPHLAEGQSLPHSSAHKLDREQNMRSSTIRTDSLPGHWSRVRRH